MLNVVVSTAQTNYTVQPQKINVSASDMKLTVPAGYVFTTVK